VEADPGVSKDIAQAILDGFDKHYRIFREISVAARERFFAADWDGVRKLQRDRIGMYDQRVVEGVRAVLERFPDVAESDVLWRRIKVDFICRLYEAHHEQPECAETFYNSVARRILGRAYYNNTFIFDRPAISTEYLDADVPTYTSHYAASADLTETFRAVIAGLPVESPWQNLARDVGYVRDAFREHRGPGWSRQTNFQVQVLRSLFFRNKSAYAVARVLDGTDTIPVVLALLLDDAGRLYVDAALFDVVNVSRVFSVGRAYFMVDMEIPSAYVEFLASIAPAKPRAELYTVVGLQKQGKTLFFRDLDHHLHHSSDLFAHAPGTRGMVMLVFTLPSYPYVFKIIRDWFEPPKDADRILVEEKYELVKRHDRAGRLADTLEFSRVALPVARLDPVLLADLERLVPSQLSRETVLQHDVAVEYLVIRHLYIERRLVPLTLFLEDADDETAREALGEYGNAVRELAGANIFPGDLLFKNFGVTRYGRVVFYDYDELCELTECRFRTLPRPRYEDDETAAEPWFFVEKNDVFPEQFPTFLVPAGRQRELFMEQNADLAEAGFWIAQQERVRRGVLGDDVPYDRRLRFPVAPGKRASIAPGAAGRR
jgi:isocitrate dehydrogenase kinase/phosphatase